MEWFPYPEELYGITIPEPIRDEKVSIFSSDHISQWDRIIIYIEMDNMSLYYNLYIFGHILAVKKSNYPEQLTQFSPLTSLERDRT